MLMVTAAVIMFAMIVVTVVAIVLRLVRRVLGMIV